MFRSKNGSHVGWLAASLLMMFAVSPAWSQNYAEDRWGWGFCAAPYPPRCVEGRPDDKAALELCQHSMNKYMSLVIAYRQCHMKQLERVVSEANYASDMLKCRLQKGVDCPLKKK